MATQTITACGVATAGNVTGAIRLEIEDSTGVSAYVTGATLRTKMFAGGTGFTAADPLTVGNVVSSGYADAAGGRFSGATLPAAGSGCEVGFVGGAAFVQGFNRTGSAFTPLELTGTPLRLGMNSTELVLVNPATRTTIGSDGGATALTAHPVGYWDVDIGGTNYQIPYYNRGA